MPANLSPEFKQAEERFRAAGSPGERLACLEEMLSTIPKHKGTEKMQADLKSRIAKLRKELGTKKGGARRQDWFHVEKQGAGQVAVFGPPNCGKSALVAALTGLPAQVAPWPFTTTAPAAGMMLYEDIQVQLVDTPPVAPEAPAWVFHIIRTADIAAWLIDLCDDDLLESTERVAGLLAEARIGFEPAEGIVVKPLLRVGTRADDSQALDRLEILRELIGEVEVLPVSVETGQGLDELKRRLFRALRITRVYTKRPGHPADMKDPVILPEGSTVLDAAQHLHKDIAAGLSFARLWNDSGYDGQRVERAHVVQDRDILEFHT